MYGKKLNCVRLPTNIQFKKNGNFDLQMHFEEQNIYINKDTEQKTDNIISNKIPLSLVSQSDCFIDTPSIDSNREIKNKLEFHF